MSISVSDRVWKYGPSNRADRTMLLALADHCNSRGGKCYPGQATLAKKAGVKKIDTVRATINRLERDGWITVIRHGGRKSNRYQIVLPMLTEEAHLLRGVTPPVKKGSAPPSTGAEPSVEPSKNQTPSLTSVMSGRSVTELDAEMSDEEWVVFSNEVMSTAAYVDLCNEFGRPGGES